MRELARRAEASRPSPQAASPEFARVLRPWPDNTRDPCIMWNRQRFLRSGISWHSASCRRRNATGGTYGPTVLDLRNPMGKVSEGLRKCARERLVEVSVHT